MWSKFTAGLQMVQEKLLEGEEEEKDEVWCVQETVTIAEYCHH